MAASRPLPLVEPLTAAYWHGARERRLVLQRCSMCQTWVHPPRPACPTCVSESLEATDASGRGSVYAFSVMYLDGGPGFDDPPYAVAVVELAEQAGLLTVGNVLDCPFDDLYVGLPVRVVFVDVAEDVTLPQWVRDGVAAS